MTAFPVPPCPHTRLHMSGARECAACWIVRLEAEDAQTAQEDEKLPFDGPMQDEDYPAAVDGGAERL